MSQHRVCLWAPLVLKLKGGLQKPVTQQQMKPAEILIMSYVWIQTFESKKIPSWM